MPYIKCPVCHKDVHASSSICPYCSTTLGDSQSSESTQYYNFSNSYTSPGRFTGYHPAASKSTASPSFRENKVPKVEHVTSADLVRPSRDATASASDPLSHLVMPSRDETASASDPLSDPVMPSRNVTLSASDSLSDLVIPQSRSDSGNSFFDSSSDDILAHIRERSKTEPSDHDAALPRQGSASRAAVYPPRMTSKVKKLPPPGRKLWGYRSGNPLLMLLSVFYYMASAVILLKGLQISPQYQEAGTLAYHYGRLISGGLMLYLPALLLSETPFRRFIPLFNSRRMGTALIGFVVLYVPLAAIFLLSWYCCL